MAIVQRTADGSEDPGASNGVAQPHSASAARWGISRRRFLVGAGVTVASTSMLGPWLRRASATAATSALPEGFVTGVSDSFEEVAQTGGKVVLQTFDELVAANASSVRFPIHWDRVQPDQKSSFDWSPYDAVYQEAVFHGLKAHPVLVGCPQWVGPSQRKRATNGVYYPTGSAALNAFGEFAVETLRHFATFGDQIETVEVWSEPNNPRGAYIADASDFSRMLSTVALFVDCANGDGSFSGAGDRRMVVLSGGLYATSTDSTWANYLARFQEQAFPYQLGLHVPAPVEPKTSSAVNYAESAADQIGAVVDRAVKQSGREIWVTGTGASAAPPWGEEGQALALGSIANALAERSGCRAMMVTGLRSAQGSTASAIDASLPRSGLLRDNGSPRPALAALQTAWATS